MDFENRAKGSIQSIRFQAFCMILSRQIEDVSIPKLSWGRLCDVVMNLPSPINPGLSRLDIRYWVYHRLPVNVEEAIRDAQTNEHIKLLCDIDFVCMFVKCGMPGCPEKNKQQIINRSNGTGNRWPTCYHLSRSPKTSWKCFHATLKQFLYPPGNQYSNRRWMKIISQFQEKHIQIQRLHIFYIYIYIILPHSNQNDHIFHPWISLRPRINDRLPCCSKLLRFRNCFRYKFLHCRGFLSIQMSGSECSGPPYAAWFSMLAGRGEVPVDRWQVIVATGSALPKWEKLRKPDIRWKSYQWFLLSRLI